jgi:integrase
LDRLVSEGRLRPSVRTFIVTAAATGCRRGELQHLVWADVDLVQARLTLRNTKGSRLARDGRTTETVSLPPVAVAALASIRPDIVDPAGLVFRPTRGREISVNHAWRMVRAEAGFSSDLVLHSLRHSVGSLGAAAGLSAFELQRLLRHRSVATTARYVHWAQDHHAQLAERALGHVLPAASAPVVDPLPLRRRGRS